MATVDCLWSMEHETSFEFGGLVHTLSADGRITPPCCSNETARDLLEWLTSERVQQLRSYKILTVVHQTGAAKYMADRVVKLSQALILCGGFEHGFVFNYTVEWLTSRLPAGDTCKVDISLVRSLLEISAYEILPL